MKIMALICIFFTSLFSTVNVYADTPKSADSQYEVIIDDGADLLTDDEEAELYDDMLPITQYGNAAFLSTDDNDGEPEDYCKDFYDSNWGQDSGTVFLIDMANRQTFIFSRGDIYKTVTSSYAFTITDNVYSMATDKDYYGCAKEAFSEIYSLLQGSKISQPMKYISNALLAVIIAAILVLLYIHRLIMRKMPSDYEILDHLEWHCDVGEITATKTGETSKYHPNSSSGGGSQGGSSGGGGGHSF